MWYFLWAQSVDTIISWYIYFTPVAAPGCGGEYTTSSGILISPNYPNSYPHNAQCIWTITVPGNAVITLTFTDLNIESHRNCRYDYVQVCET